MVGYGSGGHQRVEGPVGVLALDRQENDVAVEETQCCRGGGHRGVHHELAFGGPDGQSGLCDAPAVLAPSHQGHIVAGSRQQAAHHPAHRTGTDHNESHRTRLAGVCSDRTV